MKKLAIIFLFTSLTCLVMGQASGFQGMLEEANRLYSEGQFEASIEQYENVIAANYESAGLFFNLGNAYYKKGDIPSAILYYEKAKKLDPTDDDVQFNLDLANSRITDKIEPLPEFFLRTWWRSSRDILSSDQWAKIGLAGLVMMLLSAFAFIASRSVMLRKVFFWAGMAFLIFMSVSFIFSTSGYRNYHQDGSAIIFTPTVTVKSSPNENSVDLFVIHEGTKVYISDQVDDWSEVRLVNGNVGWVRSSVYRLI